MKIKVTLNVDPYNGIRFYDACKAAAVKLEALGLEVLNQDNAEDQVGRLFLVLEVDDSGEYAGDEVGQIKVVRR